MTDLLLKVIDKISYVSTQIAVLGERMNWFIVGIILVLGVILGIVLPIVLKRIGNIFGKLTETLNEFKIIAGELPGVKESIESRRKRIAKAGLTVENTVEDIEKSIDEIIKELLERKIKTNPISEDLEEFKNFIQGVLEKEQCSADEYLKLKELRKKVEKELPDELKKEFEEVTDKAMNLVRELVLEKII